MSFPSLFNLAILSSIFAVPCSQSHKEIASVAPEEYNSSGCWFDATGELSAFLVLGNEDNVAVPYLISNKCLINGAYSSDGEAIIHHLNAVIILDDKGIMQNAFSQYNIVDATNSDLPTPASNDKVYYFRSIVQRIPSKRVNTYVPVRILELSELDLEFEAFLRLSKEERVKLFQGLTPGP